MIKSIIIPAKKGYNNKTKNTVLSIDDSFVEVDFKYLKHLHSSYIKYSNKISGEISSGGFLQSVTKESIVLRLPAKSETDTVQGSTNIFYIKADHPNYISLRELILWENNLRHRESHIKNIFN